MPMYDRVHKCIIAAMCAKHQAYSCYHQPRRVATVCPHELGHLALPRGCDGDGHGHRMLTWMGAISLLAAGPPEEIASQL
jgi:hypothetical protein